MKRRDRTFFGPVARGALAGVLCGLVAWAIAQHPLIRGLEDWLQDACFAWRGARASTSKIVIVGIDNRTLAHLPKPLAAISPELAEVVHYLNEREAAAAIGLDFLIPEALDAYDEEHGLGGDRLGRAADQAGNVVLPAQVGEEGHALVRPLSSWQASLSPMALVELTPDVDRIVRRHELAAIVGGETHDQMALALLNVAGLVRTDRQGDVQVDGRAVPLDNQRLFRINFLGPPGTVREVSFQSVLEAARGGPRLAVDFGKAIVIIGVTARSLGDYHPTPYANGTLPALLGNRPRLMSGPELQANAVATLADGAFITTPWWLASLPWVLVLGGVLGAAFARLSLFQGLLLATLHHWGWKVVAILAFGWGSWRVESAAMLLTGALAYGAVFALRWRWLRVGMRGVVKGDVLARVLEGEASHPGLRGEERDVSILFADIRGFTSWSRRHTPREAVALLNTYFEAMIGVIEGRGGMVDKYLGDGIMAIFGAPDDRPDHAEQAVEAAVAMVGRSRELATEWERHDFAGFRIGVGVATGPALVGMVGGRRRLDYTAIGDTVNRAARIESANKELKSEVLIDARTRDAVPPSARARLGCAESPEQAVAHGIAEGLTVYRVEGPGVPSGIGPAKDPSAIIPEKETTT